MNGVVIEYLLNGHTSWLKMEIPLSDYFDNFQDGDSIFEGIERNYLEPRDYIDKAHSTIMFMNFTIYDNDNKIIVKYTYWNNGFSQIKEYNEFIGNTKKYKTIICSVNTNEKDIQLLLRLEEIKGQLVPITHSIGEPESNNFKKFDLSIFERLEG